MSHTATEQNMSDNVLSHIVTGIFGLLTAAAGWVGKIFWDLYRTRRDNTISKVINGVKDVYQYMNLLRRETGAMRVLVIKIHNGGGKPKLTTGLYGSVLYADWESGLKDGLDWVNQRLDPAYIDTLNQVLTAPDAWLDLNTDSLPDGQLKDLLAADGAAHVMFSNLVQTDNNLVLLKLNFSADVVVNARTRTTIRSVTSNLRTLFKQEPVH